VPVEADGSAYFRAPARVPLAFQALDKSGQARQRRGERITGPALEWVENLAMRCSLGALTGAGARNTIGFTTVDLPLMW
jgi:hypothetical protein